MGPTQTVFPITDVILPFLAAIFKYAASFWWLWMFLLLLVIFEETWLFYRQSLWKKTIEWEFLEIIIPREIEKTPKAMEQVLLNIFSLRNAPGDFIEKYIDGEVTRWWSLEIISYGGEIHFYIRTPKKFRKMVEASFYSHYPTIEIIQVSDYVDKIPDKTYEFYQNEYQMFGSEIILRKEDIYPIRTYDEFKTSPEEGETLDPISAMLEVLSKIDKKENVYIQILIQPAGSDWIKQAEPIIKKLKLGTKIEEKAIGTKGEKIPMTRFLPMSPGDIDKLKAIENSVSKPGFNTLIRFLYTAPKAIYSVNFARKGIIGAFNQYSSPNLNSFRGNSRVETRTKWIYFPHYSPTYRTEARKQRMLENYKARNLPEKSFLGKLMTSHLYSSGFPSKTCILNTEELATIFHPPSKHILTGPHIKLSPSKKMGPPAGLPIFTQE